MHYLARLEQATKNNWDKPAMMNFKGDGFTFGEMATQIAKFHIFFETTELRE